MLFSPVYHRGLRSGFDEAICRLGSPATSPLCVSPRTCSSAASESEPSFQPISISVLTIQQCYGNMGAKCISVMHLRAALHQISHNYGSINAVLKNNRLV